MGGKKKFEIASTSADTVPKKKHSNFISWLRRRLGHGRNKKNNSQRGLHGNTLSSSTGNLCDTVDRLDETTSVDASSTQIYSLSTEELNARSISSEQSPNINAPPAKRAVPIFMNDLNAKLGIRPTVSGETNSVTPDVVLSAPSEGTAVSSHASPSSCQVSSVPDSSPSTTGEAATVLNHRLMVNKQKKRPPSRSPVAETYDLFQAPIMPPLDRISEEVKDEQRNSLAISTKADKSPVSATPCSPVAAEPTAIHQTMPVESASVASTDYSQSPSGLRTSALTDNQSLGGSPTPTVRSTTTPAMLSVTPGDLRAFTFRSNEFAEANTCSSASLKMATTPTNPTPIGQASRRQKTKTSIDTSPLPTAEDRSDNEASLDSVYKRASMFGVTLGNSKSLGRPKSPQDSDTTRTQANTMKVDSSSNKRASRVFDLAKTFEQTV